jgi:hypothetical protein
MDATLTPLRSAAAPRRLMAVAAALTAALAIAAPQAMAYRYEEVKETNDALGGCVQLLQPTPAGWMPLGPTIADDPFCPTLTTRTP